MVKLGSCMESKILRIADYCGQDTGGQSFKLAEAIRRHSLHESHSFRLVKDYINFPVEMQFPPDPEQLTWLREYLAQIDIAHIHSYYHYKNKWGRINPEAKLILHMHGRPGKHWALWKAADEKMNGYRVVSTLNLLEYVNEDPARWIPAPFDVDEIKKLQEENYVDDGVFRIAHSPTNRGYKKTDIVISSVENLQKKGLNVELVLIEHKTNATSLKLRSACDATFDQIHLAMGNSGLEGCCLGQVVFVGAPDNVYRRYKEITGGLPFVPVTEKDFEETLQYYVENKAVAAWMGSVAYKYVKIWHDYPIVAKKVIGIYEKVLGL